MWALAWLGVSFGKAGPGDAGELSRLQNSGHHRLLTLNAKRLTSPENWRSRVVKQHLVFHLWHLLFQSTGKINACKPLIEQC